MEALLVACVASASLAAVQLVLVDIGRKVRRISPGR
jgi:hypothetical protein